MIDIDRFPRGIAEELSRVVGGVGTAPFQFDERETSSETTADIDRCVSERVLGFPLGIGPNVR